MAAITEKQRTLIGVESEPKPATYPVNDIMARFWCEMVEDANPIYFDEAYARTTWLQGKIAPPAMILTWRMPAFWPEVRTKNAVEQLALEGCTATIAVNAVQEFEMPLRYGDTLTVTTRIDSVSEEKTTRLGTGHFVSTVDTFRNQHGQIVGTHAFSLFIYRPHAGEDGA